MAEVYAVFARAEQRRRDRGWDLEWRGRGGARVSEADLDTAAATWVGEFETREPVKAAYERSDVCVVPAAGVAAEAMVALTIARLVVENSEGIRCGELQRNFDGYCEQIRAF